MAAYDAITEAPPPSRHWDDPDSEQLLLPAPEIRVEFEWLEEGAAKLLSRLSLKSDDDTASSAANPSSSDAAQQQTSSSAATTTMELSTKHPPQGHDNVTVLVIGTSKRSARLLRHVAGESGSGSSGGSGGGSRDSRSDKGSGFYPAARIHCTQVADENQIGSRKWSPAQLFLSSPHGVYLLAVGEPELPAENCVSWVEQVMARIEPRWTVILSDAPPRSLMLQSYASSSADGQSGLAMWKLASDAMHDVAATLLPLLSTVPPFPCGSLVQGLPAALITHFQIQSQPAALLVSEQQPARGNDSQVLRDLGAVLKAVFETAGVRITAAVDEAVTRSRDEGAREASVSALSELYA